MLEYNVLKQLELETYKLSHDSDTTDIFRRQGTIKTLRWFLDLPKSIEFSLDEEAKKAAKKEESNA